MESGNPGTSRVPNTKSFQFLLEVPAQSKKRKRSASLPQTEEQWQSSRMECGLDTPEHILDKITRLVCLDLSQNGYTRPVLQNWQKIVVIAAAIVDSFAGKDEDAALALEKIHGHLPGYETRRKEEAGVLRLIGLFDRLYPALEHRAFELLVTLDIPLSKLRQWTSKNYEEIQSQFSKTPAPKEEIQASVPFYLPFLVHLLRPRHTLEDIQKALKTNQLGQLDFERFQETCDSRKLTPCLLNTLGDRRIPHCDDFDLGKPLHVEKIYSAVVRVSIDGYKIFDISKELQKRALRVKREQKVCACIERPGMRLVQFDWSPDIHTPVTDKTFDELGILPRQDIIRQKASLRHDYGAFRNESPSLQIIIPTASPGLPLFVSLSSSELSHSIFNHRIQWKINRGLLLEQGTALSTTRSISFISIFIPPPQE